VSGTRWEKRVSGISSTTLQLTCRSNIPESTCAHGKSGNLLRFRHSNKCKNLQNVSGEENASADFLIVAFQPTDQSHNLNAISI
jgi:hypothetical protein